MNVIDKYSDEYASVFSSSGDFLYVATHSTDIPNVTTWSDLKPAKI